ncbi:MAG TPA: hypothetical protein VHO47_03900 [Candidatus Babeliales bacterium]|nr:hypothetical protein [Candidatus Babeliales bacterium]
MKNGILHSWKESVIIFIPRNLKIFFLATINAFIKALKPFFLYFFPFLIIWIGYDSVCRVQSPAWCLRLYYPAFFIFALINAGMIAAIRPSTAKKDGAYYKGLWFQLICAALLDFLYTISMGSFSYSIYSFLILPFIVMPIITMALFFMLDAPMSIFSIIKSLKRATLFVFYNYPFFIISIVGYFLLFGLIFLLFGLLLQLMRAAAFLMPIIQLIGIFILMCWFSIMYTKRVYEQYEIYK